MLTLYKATIKLFHPALAIGFFLLCAGCVNLTGVREFAKTSAETAAFQEHAKTLADQEESKMREVLEPMQTSARGTQTWSLQELNPFVG